MEGKKAICKCQEAKKHSEKLMRAMSEERMVLYRRKLAIQEFC